MTAINIELANFVLPQAPIKTLWFEFLLQPDRLEQHLAGDADPPADDLIIQFLNNSQQALLNQPAPPPATIPINPVASNGGSDTPNSDGKKSPTDADANRKSYALKILALKTLCYINWDLKFIESKLPLPMQNTLFEELLQLCQDPASPCLPFAEITFNRWIIRSIMKSAYPVRQQKGAQLAIPLIQQIDPLFVPHEILDSTVKRLHASIHSALTRLTNFAEEKKPTSIYRPKATCFSIRMSSKENGSDTGSCDWKQVESVNIVALADEVKYELARYYFFTENYPRSVEFFEMIAAKNRSKFDKFNDYLNTSAKMCELSDGPLPGEINSIDYLDEAIDLVLKGNSCDLTFIERRVDVKILANKLNAVYAEPNRTPAEKRTLKKFATYISARLREIKPLLNFLGSPTNRQNGFGGDVKVEPMDIGVIDDLSSHADSVIIEAIDPEVILNYSSKITRHPLDINRNWIIPRSHQEVISRTPPAINYKFHLILAKAQELRNCNYFIESRTLYRTLLEDVQVTLPDLAHLISTEILRTDLEHYLATNELDEKCADLLDKSHCILLQAHKISENSPELIELSTMYKVNLINHCLNEKGMLKNMIFRMREYCTSKNPIVRLSGLLFNAISEPEITVKNSKELWNALCGAISEPPHRIKHLKTNPPIINSQEFQRLLLRFKPNLNSPSQLIDNTNNYNSPIDVITSAMIHIFNCVRDKLHGTDLKLSLPQFPRPIVWPSHISPPHDKNILFKTIKVVLTQLLDKLLEAKPTDINWLRARAELSLVNEDYHSAMRDFISLLTVTTEFFTSFSGNANEEQMIKHMASCCSKLKCHTEAAVLQQMKKEVDYSLALRELSEPICFDSCDQLYSCIWDINILEDLVCLHTRNGEHDRKQLSLQLIGQLELNANNSSDILKEAANVRKAKFFRILSKKYL